MVSVKYPVGIWNRLMDLVHAQKFWMKQIIEEFEITIQMAQALHEVPQTGSITMKALANELWCDASNATGIVDRLESRGFVERRPAERDRRVKCVVLTAAGKRLRRKIDGRLSQSPPAIVALTAADQTALNAILERALANVNEQREGRAG